MGFDESISDLELIKVYKALIKKYHPDNNLDVDTTEKFIAIQNAYKEIVEYRMTSGSSHLGYESTDKDFFKFNSNSYGTIMGEDAYNELMNYIYANYDSIPKRNLFGHFGRGKIFKNEVIQECDLEFVDGYTEIVTGVFDCADDFAWGFFGPTEELQYNFINKDGKFLFVQGKTLMFTYLGRNIFFNIYSDYVYYLCSPNKAKQLISLKSGEFCRIYDMGKFLDDVVVELNRKYSMEARGMKYVPTPKPKKEWIQRNEYGSKSNVKKILLRFVEEISNYDDMTRDMYLPNMLPDNNIEKELEDNDGCIKKFIKKITA